MPRASRLFLMCTRQRWDEALDLVDNCPEEAASLQWTGKRGAAPISAIQVVLAHAKCRGDVPLDLIDALLRRAPHMAAQRHLYTGNLPLHAVFYNPFFSAAKRTQIAEKIIAACPSSATSRNNDGRTPLHTICSQHCNYEPIVALLRAAPQTASWPDHNGDLPIHLACKSLKSPNKSIRALHEAYRKGVLRRNMDGLTPLDIATSQQQDTTKTRSRVVLLQKLEGTSGKSRPEKSDMEVHIINKSPKCEAVFDKQLLQAASPRVQRDQSRIPRADSNAHSPQEEQRCSCESRIFGEAHTFPGVTFMEKNTPHILLSMRMDISK